MSPVAYTRVRGGAGVRRDKFFVERHSAATSERNRIFMSLGRKYSRVHCPECIIKSSNATDNKTERIKKALNVKEE